MGALTGPASPPPTPLVSVIVAAHDRARVLSRALRSAVGQTIRDLEVIVVDDASTDDTADVAARWAAEDDRIRLHRLPERVGAAAARNHGVRCSRGEYLAILDDDDEWLPRKLEKQLPVLESNADVGLVCSAFFVVGPSGGERLDGLVGPPLRGAHAALIQRNLLGHSSVVMRRAPFERVGGYDERLPRLHDWELWLRLSEVTRFAHVREPLVRIYEEPGRLSTNGPALMQAARLIVETYRGRGSAAADLADLQGTLGRRLMAEGRTGDARALFLSSLRLSPWSAKRLGQALLALASPAAYQRARRIKQRVLRLRGARAASTGDGENGPG